MSTERQRAEWEPAAWESFGEVIKPAELAILRSVVSLSEYAEADICTLCAIACEVQWPLKEGAAFMECKCFGCGRVAPTTKVKNWTWKS